MTTSKRMTTTISKKTIPNYCYRYYYYYCYSYCYYSWKELKHC
jgi:hypothetical protein